MRLPVRLLLEPFFPRLDMLEASLMSTDPSSTCIVLGRGRVALGRVLVTVFVWEVGLWPTSERSRVFPCN